MIERDPISIQTGIPFFQRKIKIIKLATPEVSFVIGIPNVLQVVVVVVVGREGGRRGVGR